MFSAKMLFGRKTFKKARARLMFIGGWTPDGIAEYLHLNRYLVREWATEWN